MFNIKTTFKTRNTVGTKTQNRTVQRHCTSLCRWRAAPKWQRYALSDAPLRSDWPWRQTQLPRAPCYAHAASALVTPSEIAVTHLGVAYQASARLPESSLCAATARVTTPRTEVESAQRHKWPTPAKGPGRRSLHPKCQKPLKRLRQNKRPAICVAKTLTPKQMVPHFRPTNPPWGRSPRHLSHGELRRPDSSISRRLPLPLWAAPPRKLSSLSLNMAARTKKTNVGKVLRLAFWNADRVHGRRMELDHFLGHHAVDVSGTHLGPGQASRFANYIWHRTGRRWATSSYTCLLGYRPPCCTCPGSGAPACDCHRYEVGRKAGKDPGSLPFSLPAANQVGPLCLLVQWVTWMPSTWTGILG